MLGQWKDVVITYLTDDNLSAEVDLGIDATEVVVLVPTIDNATVGINISEKSGGTFYPVQTLDDNATGHFLHASTASTGVISLLFKIGGAQFVKVATGAAMTADKTFRVRGVKRN